MKRCDFFRLTGAAAAAALFGRVSSVSAANTDFVKGRRVDFHSHAILPSYSEGLKRLGIDAAAEEGFTRVASEALGMPASAFYVLIQENEPENWGVGGKTLPKFMAERK